MLESIWNQNWRPNIGFASKKGFMVYNSDSDLFFSAVSEERGRLPHVLEEMKKTFWRSDFVRIEVAEKKCSFSLWQLDLYTYMIANIIHPFNLFLFSIYQLLSHRLWDIAGTKLPLHRSSTCFCSLRSNLKATIWWFEESGNCLSCQWQKELRILHITAGFTQIILSFEASH